jgi:hypothetical protein
MGLIEVWPCRRIGVGRGIGCLVGAFGAPELV